MATSYLQTAGMHHKYLTLIVTFMFVHTAALSQPDQSTSLQTLNEELQSLRENCLQGQQAMQKQLALLKSGTLFISRG